MNESVAECFYDSQHAKQCLLNYDSYIRNDTFAAFVDHSATLCVFRKQTALIHSCSYVQIAYLDSSVHTRKQCSLCTKHTYYVNPTPFIHILLPLLFVAQVLCWVGNSANVIFACHIFKCQNCDYHFNKVLPSQDPNRFRNALDL